MAYEVISKAPTGIDGYGVPSLLGAFGDAKAPACPPFKFVCPPVCPFPGFLCGTRNDLCGRLLGAINLANRAAARLETKPQSQATLALFRGVFGQAPSDPWEIPGQPGRTRPAGDLVARRFRAVANELKTRDTTYRCVPSTRCQIMKSGGSGCSGGGERVPLSGGLGNFQLTDERRPLPDLRPDPGAGSRSRSCHPTDVIVVDNDVAMALLCKNEVWLCPGFWQLKKKEWQEGTVLHEMFHLCFGLTCAWFQHDEKERARNSAYCYEVFALKIAGIKPEQVSEQKCKDALRRSGNP